MVSWQPTTDISLGCALACALILHPAALTQSASHLPTFLPQFHPAPPPLSSTHPHQEDGEHAHEHDSSISSVGITREGTCDMDSLQAWLRKLLTEQGNDLFRSKGVLSVDGSDDRYVFQGVHMLLQMTCSSQGDCPPWAPGEKRLNRIVFIGRNLDRCVVVWCVCVGGLHVDDLLRDV